MRGRGKRNGYADPNTQWYVGIYARRSFDDHEEEESNTITNQKNMITDYVESMPNTKIYDYYLDDGFSGTNFKRPEFTRLFNDVKQGNVNMIIVKDLSRLGRNYIEVGKFLDEIFPLYHLRIISINDNVDSYLNPESLNNLIVPIKNLINESYARDISKKVSSSYLAMAKAGKYIAGTYPYGYKADKNDKHHLVPDEEEKKIVIKIFRLALEGYGRIKIVQYLNTNHILCRKEKQRRIKYNLAMDESVEEKYLWSSSTIGRMLCNEVYIGNLVQLKTVKLNYKDKRETPKPKEDWVVVKNTHEAIIDEDTFNKVQKLIKKNNLYKHRDKECDYSIYSGKIKCADCRRAMTKQKNAKGDKSYPTFVCLTHMLYKGKCSPHKIRISLLDELVLDAIEQQVKLVIELDKSIKKNFFNANKDYIESNFNNNLRLADIKINKYKENKRDAYKNYKQSIITMDEYLDVVATSDQNIESINKEIEVYKVKYLDAIKKIKQNDYWINHYKRNRKIKKITKEVLDELIDEILVTKEGNIIVKFKYQDEYQNLLNFYLERNKEECQNVNGKLVSI